MIEIEERVYRVPEGRWWLGDPCYAVKDHTLWLRFCEEWYPDNTGHPVSALATVDDNTILAFGTAWGDGVYHDQRGNQYPVDAGILGMVPAALWTPGASAHGPNERPPTDPLGRWVDVPAEGWQCYVRDKNGREADHFRGRFHHFGPVTIDTDWDDDEEEF